MCTEFAVDSSSRFSFTAWTHTHADKVTDATDHPTNDYTAGLSGNNKVYHPDGGETICPRCRQFNGGMPYTLLVRAQSIVQPPSECFRNDASGDGFAAISALRSRWPVGLTTSIGFPISEQAL